MDPSRHHDFIGNNDDRTNRNSYYGREIPEIASHHYYGPSAISTRTGSNTRKTCGCTTTNSGTTAGSVTCNGCRLNSADEGWPTIANPNQIEHPQQRGAVGAEDYHQHNRIVPEATATVRTNIRQSPMYMQHQHQHSHHQQAPQQHHVSHMQQQPPNLVQHLPTQHPAHVGNMPGSRTSSSYWPQSSSGGSTTIGQAYAASEEHLRALPTQQHLDNSVTRRNAPAVNQYGQYKSLTTMQPNNSQSGQHSGVGSGNNNNLVSGCGYQLPSSSSLNSSMSIHQRVNTIPAAGVGSVNAAAPGPTNVNSPYMSKERIYEQHKYSSSTSSGSKMSYNITPTSSMYDSHHHLSNQAISKTLAVDHHVINPSNLPSSKDQHPSPNYARKCPQMYTPEEQSTAHQHLYMSTPQFSSDKFTRASPQHAPPADFTKLHESPSGNAYMVATHSEKYSPHMHSASHLRESQQFSSHTPSARNPSAYYATNQTPSKILPPEMSPIIMKQSHNTHYQYSKSPLPPPLPPSHMQQQQQTTLPTAQMAAKSQTSASLGASSTVTPSTLAPGSSQRSYIMDNVKREDLELYEGPHQVPSSRTSGGSGGIYINPYNTPPPTGDNCCKEVALSASSSPYTTGSVTPNYRVESPQFYPTKYGKLGMAESLNSSKHSLINQNTPPPSRAPSQRGGQHQTNYFYEGNLQSAPSPAAATAASPSPSALLTTTSQTSIHHMDYTTPGPGIGPPQIPIHCSVPNIPQTYTTHPSSSAQTHHHHQPASAAMRSNDLMITAVQPSSTHPYERAIHHQTQPPTVPTPPQSQHISTKHVIPHPPSNAPANSSLQMPAINTNPTKTSTKHQKPNYRELINQKLAMRNATSEEELNLQIIKKTLNVDTQSIRMPTNNQLPSAAVSRNSIAVIPTQQLPTERIPTAIRGGDMSAETKHTASVLVKHNTAVTMPTTPRIIEVPEALPQRICIKQEDDKPSSSICGTTSSSPLDLSMRTVKTKADSTEYKYQQKPRLPATASSTTSLEGRYTLPRVDSTPVFSVHAFEPNTANNPPPSRQPPLATNPRHNSLDRRNYTPPTQTHTPLGGGSTYPPSTTQHIPTSSTYQSAGACGPPTRRRDDLTNNLPQQSPYSMGCYENSLVIKTAPKLGNSNSDLAVRPSTILAPAPPPVQASRPSVLETNPYATVIKSETKRLQDTPPASSDHTLAAVDRLPPDTSIMALPARNPYGIVRSAIQSNHNANISSSNATPPSNYTLACEKNPNFLGRKRHLQEYSNQMALNEPQTKQKRHSESPPQKKQPPKPQIAMRPADISVIAVNDVTHENFERKSQVITNKPTTATINPRPTTNQPTDAVSTVNSNAGVISSAIGINNSKVIVNNVNANVNNQSSPALMACKQEPLMLTADKTNKPAEVAVSASTARIRTKAELKGFTFNPPPPQPKQAVEVNNSSPTPPPKIFPIKQEEETEVSGLVRIKEEIPSKIEMPTIPGLDDEFEEGSLLDFGWNSTCNNFMEQLLTRPSANCKKLPLKKLHKDSDMVVTSSEAITITKNPLENNSFSTIESADNTTRSSFAKLDAGSVESSSITFNNLNQDSINSQGSGVIYKKLTKTEREKKRFQQEQRLAERLKAKESSSETEDELDKRKTERLKKPPMKTKYKIKSPKSGAGTNSNSSSNSSLTYKNRFSDCGSDSTSSSADPENENVNSKRKSVMKTEIKKEKMEDEVVENKERQINEDKVKHSTNNETIKCDITIKKEQDKEDEEAKTKEQKKAKDSTKKSSNNDNNKTKEIKISLKKDKSVEVNYEQLPSKKPQQNTSEEDEEQEEENEKVEEHTEEDEANNSCRTKVVNSPSKEKFSLNTMTRSKRKQELEQQLANSKVLRNEKIIRNFSTTSTSSSNKIKRKYNRKYNAISSILETGGLSRESGIMKSTRLRAKLERNGGKLNLLKSHNNKTSKNNNKLTSSNNNNINTKEACLNKLKNSNPENDVHDRNVIDLYRFKRALKVPPSLISIKHPGAHKIAASLPDLERHAEALEAYAKRRKKRNSKNQKLKSDLTKIKNDEARDRTARADTEEPKSIIDLLHSRVTKASALNARNKATTTTAAYRPPKPCCTTSLNNSKSPANNNNNNNCGMFSETSQTTESSELQMLPELKKDSDDDDENDDNESANGSSGKKRHFSIFDTKVLPTKTRTESKLQQKKENIREIFVGDDRPASAPPEMIQSLDCSSEKMTYEQKYEQFLQQMNIVINADKLGRLGRSSTVKKLPSSTGIKQEEGDTESTSVIDADELKEDQKSESIKNHLRKRRGKYLRRKGSSGFDYIRKKKKPNAASTSSNAMNLSNGPVSNLPQFSIKSEKFDADEYENKVKTEDDVSREIQKWVLNKGVGQSAMHKAARLGYIDVIVYCLDRMSLNPDQKDNAGYTPLHEACTNGWLNIARVLLQYGANHSEAAHSGIRPLHEASENDHEEIVRLLLSYGADPLLATYSGQTPLMLASSKTMRDILSNHLVDVQSMGPERKPWKFTGPWEIYDSSECGYNVFEGAPNTICDMSRALLRKGSVTNSQIYQNFCNNNNDNNKLPIPNTINTATTVTTSNTTSATINVRCSANNNNYNSPISTTTTTATAITSTVTTAGNSAIIYNNDGTNNASSFSKMCGNGASGNSSSGVLQQQEIEGLLQQQQDLKGETSTKTVMEKCAVVLDNIDRFNTVRLYNDNKPEILVENSDSDGEMFEFEEADVLLPPLYLLKDEGTQDKWVLLNDLCNLLKVKSKDTLLNKIYPSTTSSTSASVATAQKSLMRELKMSDFLEKATCLQLLCAGEKLNICASKVVLIKYNENVRNLLGVKTILMKF